MVCGAILCENCQMVAGYAQSHLGAEPLPVDPAVRYSAVPLYHTVCSWECFDRWAWTFISRGHAPSVIGQNYVLGGSPTPPRDRGTSGRDGRGPPTRPTARRSATPDRGGRP